MNQVVQRMDAIISKETDPEKRKAMRDVLKQVAERMENMKRE